MCSPSGLMRPFIRSCAKECFDYWINKNWGLNMDAKYIDLNVDASVNNGALNAYDVDINPWIIGAGVSYRF